MAYDLQLRVLISFTGYMLLRDQLRDHEWQKAEHARNTCCSGWPQHCATEACSLRRCVRTCLTATHVHTFCTARVLVLYCYTASERVNAKVPSLTDHRLLALCFVRN